MKERYFFIDWIRVCAVMLVVTVHCVHIGMVSTDVYSEEYRLTHDDAVEQI